MESRPRRDDICDLSLREKRQRVAKDAAKKRKANGKGDRKGVGKGAKGGGKPYKQAQQSGGGSLVPGPSASLNGKKVKSAKGRGTQSVCIFFNGPKECNKSNGSCAFQHKCSVITALGRACEANHSAHKHPGKFLVA